MEKEELKTRLKEAVEEYINAHLSYRRWAISATSRGDKQAPIFKDIVQKHGIVFESIPKAFLNRVEKYKAHCEMYARPGEFGDSNYDDLDVEEKKEPPYGIDVDAVKLTGSNLEELTQKILEDVAEYPEDFGALVYQILTDKENILRSNNGKSLTKDQKIEILRAIAKSKNTQKAPELPTETDLEQKAKSERFQLYRSLATRAGESYETGRGKYRRTERYAGISSILSDIKWDKTFTKEEVEQVTALIQKQYENRYKDSFKGVEDPFEAKKEKEVSYSNEGCEVSLPRTCGIVPVLRYSSALIIAQKMLEDKYGYNPEVASKINTKFENVLSSVNLSDDEWTTVVGFHYLFPEEEIDKIIQYHEKSYSGYVYGGHKVSVKNLKSESDMDFAIDRETINFAYGIINDPDLKFEDVLEEVHEWRSISDILTFVNHLKEIAKGKEKTSNSNNLDAMLSSAGSQKGKGKSSIYE